MSGSHRTTSTSDRALAEGSSAGSIAHRSQFRTGASHFHNDDTGLMSTVTGPGTSTPVRDRPNEIAERRDPSPTTRNAAPEERLSDVTKHAYPCQKGFPSSETHSTARIANVNVPQSRAAPSEFSQPLEGRTHTVRVAGE